MHTEGDERDFCLQAQIQDGGGFYCDLFSNHPYLYKTQAPISHDLVSKCALGQVIPSKLKELQL